MLQTLAVAILLTGATWAAPGDRALVLSSKGRGNMHVGQLFAEGSTLRMAAGDEAVLLELAKGQRVRVWGPSTVTVGAHSIEATDGHIQALEGPKTTLALTGQNFRQVGGITTRRSDGDPLSAAQINQSVRYGGLTASLMAGETTLSLEVSPEPGRAPAPLHIQVVSDPMRTVGADGKLYYQDQREVLTPILCDSVVKPEPTAAGIRYRVNLGSLPPSQNGAYFLSIIQKEGDDERLKVFTRFRPLSPQSQREMDQSLTTIESWTKEHPGGVESYVTAITLLEEFSQLSLAQAWIQRALKLDPQNSGLRQMRLQVALDAGNYQQAKALMDQGITLP